MASLISKIITWAMGNKWGLVAAGVVILAALGVGNYLVGQIDKLTAQNQTLALERSKLIAAAEGQAAVIKHLQESHKRDNAIINQSAQEQDALTVQNRKLERRLAEAIKNVKEIDTDTRLPDSIVDALCLRWHSASGLLPAGSDTGNTAGSSDARKGDTDTAPCRGWRGRITLADMLEWNGDLLDHAGAERLDKAALRLWTGGQQ